MPPDLDHGRTSESPRPTRVLVIGGGPAGLMAAEQLAGDGITVTVADRMPSVGRKLLLAGRGGLNLTHSEALPVLLDRYGPARSRLESAVTSFDADALREWAAGLGEPTFVGSSGRVFPTSFRATPLLRAWLARLTTLGVEFRMRRRWIGWDEAQRAVFELPDGSVELLDADATVLALGGASWPRTGSDGGWVPILRSSGVTVVGLGPANGGFVVEWSPSFVERFAGVPLKNLRVTASDGASARGEGVVTINGVEGGVFYAVGRSLRRDLAATGSATAMLDLAPDLDAEILRRRLDSARVSASTSSVLRSQARLSDVARALFRECSPALLPRDQLADRVKALPVRLVAATPIDRAISSSGGIALGELDERWMLRARPGTFAIGEMLDWEAPTGGYLLQAAFSMGHDAARGVVEWLAERDGRSW